MFLCCQELYSSDGFVGVAWRIGRRAADAGVRLALEQLNDIAEAGSTRSVLPQRHACQATVCDLVVKVMKISSSLE